MDDFRTFITEERQTGPDHVHDLMIGHGNEGVAMAGNVMDAVHRKLLGKHSAINITLEHGQDLPDPVMKPSSTSYTPHEQRRYLDHMENAKRVYSQMKPDTIDIVGTHGHHLKKYLSGLSRKPDPHETDGFLDYLTKQHENNTDKTDHSVGEDKKRHSYSNAITHVAANRQHYDKALELHHHLGRARDVLTHVISKNYKQAGHKLSAEGAMAVGKMGKARFARGKQ